MGAEKYLVSDLDGTLIPWEGVNRLGSLDSLKRLNRKMREHRLGFVILTGRSFPNILQAMKDYPLPEPELIFSSAGAVLHRRKGKTWQSCVNHQSYLEKRNPLWDREDILTRLSSVGQLKNQGEVHQSRFKLSYYLYTLDYEPVMAEVEKQLGNLNEILTMQIYPEPDMGLCYLDIMALESDKKGALDYLKKRELRTPCVFAGDNWNDRCAFLSNHPSILVENTPADLKRETERVNPRQIIARGKTNGRTGKFADGVLEGLENMGWVL